MIEGKNTKGKISQITRISTHKNFATRRKNLHVQKLSLLTVYEIIFNSFQD